MLEFTIPTMSCGGCAGAIQRAVTAVDPHATVEADPPQRALRVRTTLARETVLATLERIGHPAQ
jgi:copper chaperone